MPQIILRTRYNMFLLEVPCQISFIITPLNN